ncbi:MAG: HAD-IB family phosphatase [Candidatus Aegiribacteria sp.]|nr:HAD-IB family phosphatase [Candidatus Aegiribacteria sp.]MBD3294719.1 HAD-IB family phosphatase [Candidatus Fermentibacteria bacterium]
MPGQEGPVRLTGGGIPAVYFVDLDGTLLSTSSEKYFLRHLLKKGLLSGAGFLRFLFFYAVHPFRTLREGKGWNRNYLKGLDPLNVQREAAQCAEELLKGHVRERTLRSMKELRERGCPTVLLSASLKYIVDGVAQGVGASGVLASTPNVTGKSFSGGLTGLRPWGRDKLDVAREYCEEMDTDMKRCAAAGDSWSDRFVLRASGCPVAVCPDRRLERLAEGSGWILLKGRHTKWA